MEVFACRLVCCRKVALSDELIDRGAQMTGCWATESLQQSMVYCISSLDRKFKHWLMKNVVCAKAAGRRDWMSDGRGAKTTGSWASESLQ